jgi:hypothetical protein
MKCNSFVFVHKSDTGCVTISWTHGNTNVTAFAEDISKEAADFLLANLSEQKTKTAADGKVRKYRMSNVKLAVDFEPMGEPTTDELGRASARGVITGLAVAPNHLSALAWD